MKTLTYWIIKRKLRGGMGINSIYGYPYLSEDEAEKQLVKLGDSWEIERRSHID